MEYRSCISSNSSPITCYNSLFQFFAWIVRISMSSCTFSAALSWSLFHYICTSFTECFVKLKLYSVYICKRFEELLYQNWIISYESWDVAIVDCNGFAVRSSHQSKYTQISLAPALSISLLVITAQPKTSLFCTLESFLCSPDPLTCGLYNKIKPSSFCFLEM